MPPRSPIEQVVQDSLGVASRLTRIPTSILDEAMTATAKKPMTVGEVIETLKACDAVHNLVGAAYRELFNRIPMNEQHALLHISAKELSALEDLAQEGLLQTLLGSADPVTVIRVLHEKQDLRVLSRHLTALLGIDEERTGGELERHSPEEQKLFDARGGYMYQASDVYSIRSVFSNIRFRSGVSFYDLGSGYGHVVFYGAIVRPDVSFKGIELMPCRIVECQRIQTKLGIMNASFEAADVVAADMSQADVLFLFNPFPPDVRQEVSRKINALATQRPLFVVDYGGMVTQDAHELVPAKCKKLDSYRVAVSKRFQKESLEIGGIEHSTTTSLKKGGSR